MDLFLHIICESKWNTYENVLLTEFYSKMIKLHQKLCHFKPPINALPLNIVSIFA